jgi:hypothetical protein
VRPLGNRYLKAYPLVIFLSSRVFDCPGLLVDRRRFHGENAGQPFWWRIFLVTGVRRDGCPWN